MNNYFYLSVLTCLLTFSCVKKKVEKTESINCEPTLVEQPSPDTLYPSDYMPAYPGSKWKLVMTSPATNNTLTYYCSGWTQKSAYEPISLQGCGSFYKKTSFVPSVMSPVIWGEKILVGFDYGNNYYYPMEISVFDSNAIDTTLYPDYQTHGSTKIDVKSYTIPQTTFNGVTYLDVKFVSVIKWEYGHYGFYPIGGRNYYFAKNIGLIRVYDPFYYIQYDLIDYYIAPH